MKKRSILLGLVIGLFLIVNVSAGLYFSQPDSYYNLGDNIKIEVSVDSVSEGFLTVNLVCDGGVVNVFNGIPGEDGVINIGFPLTFAYIEENSGNCYFEGYYGDETQQSRGFEISKALDVQLYIDNLAVKPGEDILITGSAKRLNGAGINGEIEIRIPLLELINSAPEETVSQEQTEEQVPEESDSGDEEIDENESETEEEIAEETAETEIDAGLFHSKVVDGEFSVTFRLNEETGAGNYRIDVLAYEIDNLGRVTSEGVAMANLNVQQVLKDIDIALNSQSIDPGQTLEFKPTLTDQTGQPISDEVSVIIRDEKSKRIFERILQSEETFQYLVQTNLSSGYYEIEASSGDLNAIKKFHVNEKAIVSFEMLNSTLVVTNVGNIPYKKDIQVELNGKPFVKGVELEMGEKQEFILTGDGEFDVKVSDGETEISQGGVVLTGHAVNVKSLEQGIIPLNTPIVWIFFIVVLGAGVLFLFRNILKKKSFAYPFKEKLSRIRLHRKAPLEISAKAVAGSKKEPAETAAEKKVSGSKENLGRMSLGALVTPNKAEQVLVLKGHKNRVAVLVIKIKSKLTKKNRKDLNDIIRPIYEKKGAVYESGDYLIAIFSPLMTHSFKNEMNAAKVGVMIQKILKEYNRKFIEKIEFGIGIGCGEVVNQIEDKKLKFTPLGNLIPSVKRISENSNEQVLLTKDAYERASPEVKAAKHGEVYEVRRIVDIEKNNEFINRFLKRIDEENKEKK